MTDSQRIIEYFSQPGWNKLFLASGKFYVLQKRMYVISLYRYDVCISSGSRGQIEIFVRETSRSLASHLHHQFCLQARTIAIFSMIATVFGVWEGFLLMGVSFLFPFQQSMVQVKELRPIAGPSLQTLSCKEPGRTFVWIYVITNTSLSYEQHQVSYERGSIPQQWPHWYIHVP